MNKHLEQKLIDEFPTFFREMYGDPKETCMSHGITCGDGWYDIIYDLCINIKKLGELDFHFKQIKEKFFTLRVYYRANDKKKEIGELIELVELKSTKTCENCGKEAVYHEREKMLCEVCQ